MTPSETPAARPRRIISNWLIDTTAVNAVSLFHGRITIFPRGRARWVTWERCKGHFIQFGVHHPHRHARWAFTAYLHREPVR